MGLNMGLASVHRGHCIMHAISKAADSNPANSRLQLKSWDSEQRDDMRILRCDFDLSQRAGADMVSTSPR